jgi:hypothetical protein
MRSWPDSHNLRKPHLKSILEGRGGIAFGAIVPTQVVTVFGNPSRQNSISTFNFPAHHPETKLEIYKIDFLNPDHIPGSGTRYSLIFLDSEGKIMNRISQWCAPSDSVPTSSMFLTDCVFNNLGGSIQIDIVRSLMTDLNQFDDCWNVIFHYKGYKN